MTDLQASKGVGDLRLRAPKPRARPLRPHDYSTIPSLASHLRTGYSAISGRSVDVPPDARRELCQVESVSYIASDFCANTILSIQCSFCRTIKATIADALGRMRASPRIELGESLAADKQSWTDLLSGATRNARHGHFCATSRETAFAKIRSRVESTAMASIALNV